MPIPAEATAVHHITDEDVKSCPTFKQVAQDLARVFTGCDVAGFNSNRFDVPLLMQEFSLAGVNIDLSRHKFVDVQNIFHKMEQRTLVAAYKFYCGKDLTEAHSANADTRATYEVLKAQLDRYPTLKNDIAFLSEFSSLNKNVDLMGRIIYNDAGVEVFNFGKYKGEEVEKVLRRDTGYYSWMMQGEFAENTKQVLTRIRMRIK
jgi:DNA polymerase-3 subunit epsilon